MTEKRRILIAGATGTLGIPLVRALLAKEYQVIGLTRSPGKRALLEQMGASAVVADVLDPQALETAVKDSTPDWVVHLLTALPKNAPTCYSHLTATNTLRIEGTKNLLQAAVAAGTQRIVGESMVFAYGFGDHGDRPLAESAPLRPKETDANLQPTVDALCSLEDQFLAANRQGQIEAIPLRCGLFYGPDSPSTRYMLDMIRKRFFPVPAGDQGSLPWIHTEDAVQATVAALENGHPGETYNIVDDRPVGLGDWAKYAADLIGAKPPLAVPLKLIKIIMPYVAAFSSARLPISNAKAKRELLWQPRYPSFREGLQAIVR